MPELTVVDDAGNRRSFGPPRSGDHSVAWIEVDGVSGERKRFNGWQFGPAIGGLGVAPGKQVVFPGSFGSFSVKLK